MSHLPAELFKVLGVATRLRIIDILKEKGAMGVKKLSDSLDITPSAVSQHLKILKHAGLVRNERKGYWIPYEIDSAALGRCGDMLSSVCRCGCRGSARRQAGEQGQARDELARLREMEEKLENKLQEVRRRIQEMEAEG